jgi:SAM-dependent methyltransferase
VASNKAWVLSRVPRGSGVALDLGGGRGELRLPIEALGYTYINVDVQPSGDGCRIRADAHALPLRDRCVALIVSSDSLEHFRDPLSALREARRALRTDGHMVVWVPFLHPFHGDDFFRFTPLGLRTLFAAADFEIVSMEAPLWVLSVLAQAVIAVLRPPQRVERAIERAAAWGDGRLRRFQRGAAFAAAYLVVARPARGHNRLTDERGDLA